MLRPRLMPALRIDTARARQPARATWLRLLFALPFLAGCGEGPCPDERYEFEVLIISSPDAGTIEDCLSICQAALRVGTRGVGNNAAKECNVASRDAGSDQRVICRTTRVCP